MAYTETLFIYKDTYLLCKLLRLGADRQGLCLSQG